MHLLYKLSNYRVYIKIINMVPHSKVKNVMYNSTYMLLIFVFIYFIIVAVSYQVSYIQISFVAYLMIIYCINSKISR